jgi:hypothetical protein
MGVFWIGVILVVLLICLVASTTLIILWRRAGIHKVESALFQLQNELSRINSLLEETRSKIVRMASEAGAPPATEKRVDSPDNKGESAE